MVLQWHSRATLQRDCTMSTGGAVIRAVTLAALAWPGGGCRVAPERAPSPKPTPAVESPVAPTVPVALKTTARTAALGEDMAVPPRDARPEPRGAVSGLFWGR